MLCNSHYAIVPSASSPASRPIISRRRYGLRIGGMVCG
jgi:hypothetical protein